MQLQFVGTIDTSQFEVQTVTVFWIVWLATLRTIENPVRHIVICHVGLSDHAIQTT
jgi:hypothetical protein